MSYKNRAKYKVLKRYVYKIQEALRFRLGHISHSGKIVIFGLCIIIISLFFPWVNSSTGVFTGGSFSKIAGKPGFLLLIISCMITFSLLSIQKKSRIQLVSNWYFKDYTSCILGGILIVILCINNLSYIGGLQMFESSIIAGKGPIFCLCGGIMIIFGGIMMKIESSKNLRGTYINDNENTEQSEEKGEKNNMKLPF